MKRVHLLFLVLLGCMDNTEKEQPDIDIVGKWQLMKTTSLTVIDYSMDQVYYEFKADGILIVESDVGVMSGEHKYEFWNEEHVNWQEYTRFANLKINDKAYGCYLAPDKMVLVDNPALDGPLIYFIKL